MILHLIEDEKVVSRMIENFETARPGENMFVCMCRKNRKDNYIPIHIKTNIEVTYFDYRYDKFEKDLSNYDLVIIHYLTYQKALFVDKYVRKDARICWAVWGGDMYGILNGYYGYKLYSDENSYHKRWTIKGVIKSVLGIERKRKRIILSFVKNQVKEIIGFEEDKELLESNIGISGIKVHQFYYYPIEQILNENLLNKSISDSSCHILCGNSGSYTGNHEYVLNILKDLDLSNWKVIMPLSYGGSPSYISKVKHYGTELLNSSFVPLKEFMPLDDYNQLMVSSRICIYGHWREEAFGNIVIALYLGAKVFVSNRNPFIKGLRRLGFIIFELERISQEELETPLSLDEKDNNRRRCLELLSASKTQGFINTIVNG